MKQSESIKNLVIALAKAQAEFVPVPKSKTGQEGNRKFLYADLADVVSMITPRLSKYGVFLSQPIVVDESGVTRQTTRLQLEDEYIQTDGIKLADDVPGKNLGISVTYARRIDLNGLLGIAPDEDVDAPDLKKSENTSFTSRTVTSVSEKRPVSKPYTKSVPKNPVPSPAPQKTDVSANPEITDDDLPPEIFEDAPVVEEEAMTEEEQEATNSIDSPAFIPLTQKRNTEIQNRLKELVSTKTVDRRKLSLFLDREHNGKKQFDVSADKWEVTIKKIEDAVKEGKEAVTALLKG